MKGEWKERIARQREGQETRQGEREGYEKGRQIENVRDRERERERDVCLMYKLWVAIVSHPLPSRSTHTHTHTHDSAPGKTKIFCD